MTKPVGSTSTLKGFKAIKSIEEFLYLFGTFLTENMNAEEAFLTASHQIEGSLSKPLQHCVTLHLQNAIPLREVFEVLASHFHSNDIHRYFRFLGKTIVEDPKIAGPIVLKSLSILKKNREIYEKRQRIYKTLFLKMYLITLVLGLVMGVVNGLAPLLGFLGSPTLLSFDGLTDTRFSPLPYWPTLVGGFFVVVFLSYKNMNLFRVKHRRIHSAMIGAFYFSVHIIINTMFMTLF